ncbi:hypothetical protein [Pseudalkalibacillus berkeleyi]|uniref:ABC transporter permease n=1 Tax=Pseudalkalibacillus berkeleyi TaxID=1069813 RepID=A0ABS9GX99_9BACL|nr:hypothetical protein [Pseudalkalibacillus berkeleyi]MCF6136281.1 hypothetical protein [Pseudalkalibacillus berkeleyi]
MNAWLSLTKKELRLGLPAFMIPVIAYIIIIGIASYFGYRAGYPWEAVVGVSITATGMLMFYLIYYLFFSMNAERKKLHLWLHNPLPAYSLLLAKVVSGLVFMAITLLITGSLTLIAANLSPELTNMVPWVQIKQFGFLGVVHFFMFALDLAIWFLFFWMVFLVMNRFTGNFLSFVTTFIFVIVSSTIYGWFTNSWIYEKLTMWGEINGANLLKSLEINTDFTSEGGQFSSEMGEMSIYIGQYVFGILFAIGMFLVASWMLERKVEV